MWEMQVLVFGIFWDFLGGAREGDGMVFLFRGWLNPPMQNPWMQRADCMCSEESKTGQERGTREMNRLFSPPIMEKAESGTMTG